jgi:hypothetical protein
VCDKPVASADQSSTNRSDVCVFISAVREGHPVISVQQGEFPPNHRFLVFDSDISRQWGTNYTVFSEALVESAKKEHLDFSSLAKVLEQVRSAPVHQYRAILPVAARSVLRDGVPVWVVSLRWETLNWVAKGHWMEHIEEFTVTQKTLKQIGFSTCY